MECPRSSRCGKEAAENVDIIKIVDLNQSHVSCVKDIYEGHAGVLSQFLVVDDFLQQWLFEWLSGAAPHLVLPTILSNHHPAQGVFGRRPRGSKLWDDKMS